MLFFNRLSLTKDWEGYLLTYLVGDIKYKTMRSSFRIKVSFTKRVQIWCTIQQGSCGSCSWDIVSFNKVNANYHLNPIDITTTHLLLSLGQAYTVGQNSYIRPLALVSPSRLFGVMLSWGEAVVQSTEKVNLCIKLNGNSTCVHSHVVLDDAYHLAPSKPPKAPPSCGNFTKPCHTVTGTSLAISGALVNNDGQALQRRQLEAN